MTELTFITEEDQDYELPSYGDPGRIFVHIITVSGNTDNWSNRYDVELIDYDGDSCVFWIQEGVGIDYWLDQCCDFEHPGFYVIEGIKGEYIRGDGWMTDDDEDWDFERIRKATPDEILYEALQ